MAPISGNARNGFPSRRSRVRASSSALFKSAGWQGFSFISDLRAVVDRFYPGFPTQASEGADRTG
jgi:hypothetical protein